MDFGTGQPQRIPRITMPDTLAWWRDRQTSTATEQVAIDERTMRIDPCGLGERTHARHIHRAINPQTTRNDLAYAAASE